MEAIVKSREELAEAARALLACLAKPHGGATLVTLSGELGVGKTALVQEIARALGVEDTVTSPTFVLEKIYSLDSARDENALAFSHLVHIDAYRLTSGADLRPLGFDELMKDPGNLVVLEWPERVADALPPAALPVSLTLLPDGSRHIIYGPAL